MTKHAIDTDWVREQFFKAIVPESVEKPVSDLIQVWENLNIETDDIPQIIEVFGSIVKGHSLLPSESEEVWMEAQRGFIHTGDTIRVRHDAFEDAAGRYHNGRVGKAIGVRSGDIIFRSTDELTPFIDGARYTVDKLERKIK